MKKNTQCITLGARPGEYRGAVNPPVYHASTILFPTLEAYENALHEHGGGQNPAQEPFTYGRYGTPTTRALEEAIAGLEGADHSFIVSSGVAAFNLALLSFLGAGDHLLMVDSAYGPTRKFCDEELSRLGIDITYYDPALGAGIRNLIQSNTKVVYVESPGSLTFEIQDIPAIAQAAHARGAIVIADNTWATPLYFKPFKHGVDVSLHSATKYIAGHSDLIMGVVSTTRHHYAALRRVFRNTGACAGPDDCYLALRGLRTLATRLTQHERTALTLASWLKNRPEVVEVRHPALPECPGHDYWKRDMTGSSGLFSVLLKPYPKQALAAMLDHMELFGMGVSWGGFESLMIPFSPQHVRTATAWKHDGLCLRIHAGLEDPEDLIRDLYNGFERLNKAV